MGEFNTEGLEELASAFRRQEEAATETVKKMLKTEAEIYTQAQKEQIAALGLKDSGGFMNSIKAGEIKTEDTAYYIEIVPEGRAPHTSDYGTGAKRKGKKLGGKAGGQNVRYATIGFIFENGTSSIPAKPWLTTANEKANDKAYSAAYEIWQATGKQFGLW